MCYNKWHRPIVTFTVTAVRLRRAVSIAYPTPSRLWYCPVTAGRKGNRANVPSQRCCWIHGLLSLLVLTTLRGAKQRLAIVADGGGRKKDQITTAVAITPITSPTTTELQSVVCNDTPIMMFRKSVQIETWHTKTWMGRDGPWQARRHGWGHWRAVPPPLRAVPPHKVGLRILASGIVLKFSILHFRIEPVIDTFYLPMSAMRRASLCKPTHVGVSLLSAFGASISAPVLSHLIFRCAANA